MDNGLLTGLFYPLFLSYPEFSTFQVIWHPNKMQQGPPYSFSSHKRNTFHVWICNTQKETLLTWRHRPFLILVQPMLDWCLYLEWVTERDPLKIEGLCSFDYSVCHQKKVFAEVFSQYNSFKGSLTGGFLFVGNGRLGVCLFPHLQFYGSSKKKRKILN